MSDSPTPDESFSIDNVLRVSARIRGELKELSLLERLELCGIWALAECIEHGHSDESIAEMFDAMKSRMLRQSIAIRTAKQLIDIGVNVA